MSTNGKGGDMILSIGSGTTYDGGDMYMKSGDSTSNTEDGGDVLISVCNFINKRCWS